MTSSNEQLVSVEQRHKDAAAWALDKAPDSMTWEHLTAAHRTPDQLWQAHRVAKAFARFEAALRTPPAVEPDMTDDEGSDIPGEYMGLHGEQKAAVEPDKGLVEKVARALAVADGHDPDDLHGHQEVGGAWPIWLAYEGQARAVIAQLTPLSRAHDTDEVWQPIDEAPYERTVEIKVGSMTFLAALHPGVSEDDEGRSCDQWQAAVEGEHPPCWSGGACWENNENEIASLPPEAWRGLTDTPLFPTRTLEEAWQPIETAPIKESVGSRSAMILGADNEGRIAKTFYSIGHPKGEAWLIATGHGLEEWDPTLWTNLPAEFQDRDGTSYQHRSALKGGQGV